MHVSKHTMKNSHTDTSFVKTNWKNIKSTYVCSNGIDVDIYTCIMHCDNRESERGEV